MSSFPEQRVISLEVYRYPYSCDPADDKVYLSEKICCSVIKTRKKIIVKTKVLLVYGQLIVSLGSGLIPAQQIGLSPLPMNSKITRSIHSNNDLAKQIVIAQINYIMPTDIDFTKDEINQLYNFSIQHRNNCLSKDELLTKINSLRGGDYVDVALALAIIGVVILIQSTSGGFQPNPGFIVPPHLQWLYGNNYQPGQFGYGKGAGPRSITVTGLAQNAGSDKKKPASGSYNYIEVMKKLEKQSSNNSIEIQVGDQIYRFKNPSRKNADELQFELAEEIYDSIRKSDMDICDIAENLGFKADNIKNVKNHVFYNEHDLDRYGPDEIEHKRFDATLEQALAWKRLEAGIHTQDDVTWIKHEYAERHHELKYDSGYSEAHERAQSRYDGYPWENKF